MFLHTQHIAGLTALLGAWLYGVYPLVKLLAYAAWCHWGGGYLDLKPGRSALKDGLIRFAIGLAFGGAVALAAAALGDDRITRLYDHVRPGMVYLAVFLPIRWTEWWIMERVMTHRPGPLIRTSRRELEWRVGGILTSFASDAPLFLLVGFLGVIA